MKPADRVRTFRENNELTTDDLAIGLGVHERTCRKWESAERTVPWPVLILIELIEAVPAARKWFLSRIKNARG